MILIIRHNKAKLHRPVEDVESRSRGYMEKSSGAKKKKKKKANRFLKRGLNFGISSGNLEEFKYLY